mmetsp:Transcript_60691/g.130330  ORF Transcript_60691/g.130330 Transcript_60691/m.130330 type:complete len:599 (-) Transcript_60691:134-1930(-)
MNKVISGYFDDSHRGLQREKSGAKIGASPSNVQLPPLHQDSSMPSLGADGYGVSDSMGSLEFSHEQAARGVQAERYQQALQDNSKLSRRVRALQDQLAITSAKKEAFRAQSARLEREFKKGREQSDSLQKELLDAKREAAQLNKESQEAMQMMGEMRKAHIHEVRLLQRGLQARGGDNQFRNKVNEVADLVDKLGRAVVSRDEAIRDKTKAQAQFSKAGNDLRAVTEEVTRLKRQNKQLSESLKEAQRKGKFVPPRHDVDEGSDEEFEYELATFEKRFQIMEEGPAGLDILASNLSKDKQTLEKRLKGQQDYAKQLNKTIEDWKKLCAEKDAQIQDLNDKLDKMMKDQAQMQESIAAKRREIELQVAEEKAALERRISELEGEADDARAAADGMEKASSRLTQELVKVHSQYGGGPLEGDATSAPQGELVTSAEQAGKTGESLVLQVYKLPHAHELRAREGQSGEETIITLDEALLGELDQEDRWTDLFSRTGVDPGPPRRIVVSSSLGRREVKLGPSATPVILTIYRYGARRYFLSGTPSANPTVFLDLVLLEDKLTPAWGTKIDALQGDALFDALASGLALEAGGKRLSFAAAPPA